MDNIVFCEVPASEEAIVILEKTAGRIRALCSSGHSALVLLCDYEDICQYLESDKGREWLGSTGLDKCFACAIQAKESIIREYLDGHPHEGYAILSREEMEPVFPGHTVYMAYVEPDKPAMEKAGRILAYGPYGEKYLGPDLTGKYGVPGYGKLVEDHIYKAVFLDIDGVLNDYGGLYPKGEQIRPEFVQNLAWIVEQSGAEIILTSSWRLGICRCVHQESTEGNPDVQRLLTALAKHHLRIAGMTPVFFNGPDGRPFEVRTWLAARPDVENFVVLDDEGFWKWKWLSGHVVKTSKRVTRNGELDFETGLSMEYAREAVEILNR